MEELPYVPGLGVLRLPPVRRATGREHSATATANTAAGTETCHRSMKCHVVPRVTFWCRW